MKGIGRSTDYASRIVLHLAALGPGAQVQVKEIAQRRLLPPAFVRRIVAELAAGGILRTVRGNKGGIALARPAEEITLLDVVRVMEGGIVLNRCVDHPHSCPLSSICPVNCAWTGATRVVEQYLRAITFHDLARNQGPKTRSEGTAAASAASTPSGATRRSKG